MCPSNILDSLCLTNHVPYSAGFNPASAVIQNSARTALALSTLAAIDWMPKAEAVRIEAKDMTGQPNLIVSFLCVAACIATGVAMPLCIAFCASTTLPLP
jgi:hypothetical protein